MAGTNGTKIIDQMERDFRQYTRKQYDLIEKYYYAPMGSRYMDTFRELMKNVENMRNLKKVSPKLYTYKYEDDVEDMYFSEVANFGMYFHSHSKCYSKRMFSADNYGIINEEYRKKALLDIKKADGIVSSYMHTIRDDMFSDNHAVWTSDFWCSIEDLLAAIWSFAFDIKYPLQKTFIPYRYENGKTVIPESCNYMDVAIQAFYHVIKVPSPEICNAKLCALAARGGNELILNEVKNMLADPHNGAVYGFDGWGDVASCLMWLKAYEAEKMVLQSMVVNKLPMSETLYQRLNYLTNHNENAPDSYDVKASAKEVYFDADAANWREDDYENLFQDLELQHKELNYALAVRDEDRDIMLTHVVKLPGDTVICQTMNQAFEDEYGEGVSACCKKGVIVSQGMDETIQGFLVTVEDVSYLQMFVHVMKIGKKLNIKFYTLYAGKQKKQAISMCKKLSPTVTVWEKSIKDTILLALQSVLNAGSTETVVSKKKDIVEF